MNKKLVKFIENSDMDENIKDFLMESLSIEERGERRSRKNYVELVEKYAEVDK